MIGRADFLFGDAAEALRAAGCGDAAGLVVSEVVGRNVLDGRWTFQMVEEFEGSYYGPVRAIEAQLRRELLDGKQHVYEAELKERRRTPGNPPTPNEEPVATDAAASLVAPRQGERHATPGGTSPRTC